MPIRVKVQDTNLVLNFPDNTPDEVISRTVREEAAAWQRGQGQSQDQGDQGEARRQAQQTPEIQAEHNKTNYKRGAAYNRRTRKPAQLASAAPEPSLLDRVTGVFTGSTQEGDTAISRFLRPAPSDPNLAVFDKSNDALSSISDTPIVRTANLTPERGAMRGVAKTVDTLFTPHNLALVGATAASGLISPPLSMAASAVFGPQMLVGAYEKGKEALGEFQQAAQGDLGSIVSASGNKNLSAIAARNPPPADWLSAFISPEVRENVVEAGLIGKMGGKALRHGAALAERYGNWEATPPELRYTGKPQPIKQPKSKAATSTVEAKPATPPPPTGFKPPESKANTTFYTEGQIDPAVVAPKPNLADPRASVKVKPAVPEPPPYKPQPPAEVQPATPKTLEQTAAPVGERFRSELEDLSKAKEPTPPTLPERHTDSSMYLGSGLGSLQALYKAALQGNLKEKVLDLANRATDKVQHEFYKAEQYAGDYTIPLRQYDELAGLKMADGADLAQSSWVGARQHAGAPAAARGHILEVEKLVRKHRQELVETANTVTQKTPAGSAPLIVKPGLGAKLKSAFVSNDKTAQGIKESELLPLSYRWAQVRSLTTDIPNYFKEANRDIDLKAKELKESFDKAEIGQKEYDQGIAALDKMRQEYTYPEGKTLDDFVTEKAEIEAKIGPQLTEVFERQANEVRDLYRKNLYNILVKPYWAPGQKGIMSQQQWDEMVAKRPNFISLKRDFSDFMQDNPFQGMGGKFSVRENTAIKGLKQGGEQKLSDPHLEQITELTQAISLAHRNSVAMKLADLSKAPGMEDYIQKVWDDYTPPANAYKLAVRRDGVTEYYAVPRHLQPVIENLQLKQMDAFTEILGKANGAFRTLVTMRPTFMTNNIIRDFWTSTGLMPHGPKSPHTGKVAQKADEWTRYMQGMANALMRGVSSDKSVLGKSGTQDMYIEYLKSFAGNSGVREYLIRGPEHQQGDLSTLKDLDRKLAGGLRSYDYSNRSAKDAAMDFATGQPISDALHSAWKGWQYLGETAELGPRMVAWRNSLENQEIPYIAGWRARNITVDFYAKGNGNVANFLRTLTPFVGARWQGTRNLLTTLGESSKELPGVNKVLGSIGVAPSRATPYQRRSAATTLTALSLLAFHSQIHNLLLYPEVYAQVDNDQKNNNLLWLTNKRDEHGRFRVLGKIPTSEFSFITEPVRGLATYIYHQHPQLFLDIARKFYPDLPDTPLLEDPPTAGTMALRVANQISPWGFLRNDQFSLQEGLSNIVPGPAQAGIALFSGLNMRTGQHIDASERGFPRDRGESYTRPTSQALSSMLNDAADKALGVQPGTQEWRAAQNSPWRSPQVLQEAVRLGGGDIVLAAGDSIIRKLNRMPEGPKVRDRPLEQGRPTEGPLDMVKTTLTTVPPSTFDSQLGSLVKGYNQEAESKNREIASAAATYITMVKQQGEEKADQFLQEYINRANLNEANTKYLDNKLTELVEVDEINAAIEKYNQDNKSNIAPLTQQEINMRRMNAGVRAKTFFNEYQRLRDKSPKNVERLYIQWAVKGLLTDKVSEELDRLLEEYERNKEQKKEGVK